MFEGHAGGDFLENIGVASPRNTGVSVNPGEAILTAIA